MMFIDESKTREYIMVAAIADPAKVDRLRRELRSLVLPGQRRIHFTKERSQRKRRILSALVELEIEAYVFYCDTKDHVRGRSACLAEIVSYAANYGHTMVVIEKDESLEKADRQNLYREFERNGIRNRCRYNLLPAREEPLLWVADAIAWSFAKGGDWRRRIEPLVRGTHKIPN